MLKYAIVGIMIGTMLYVASFCLKSAMADLTTRNDELTSSLEQAGIKID